MVGVPGFEPGASWTRTKRDTKLRHTPLQPLYYMCFFQKCQALSRYFLPCISHDNGTYRITR